MTAYKYSRVEAGGSEQDATYVNNAKKCLSSKKDREEYNAALEVYGLKDGLQKDKNWEQNLKKRLNRAPTEVN